jgi:hypothetical protein
MRITYVFAFINLFIILFLTSPPSFASVNVDIYDDIYDVISRLEAEGIIQSSLLTTKPLTRGEITRLILEAESNAEGKGPLIRQLIEYAKSRFKAGAGHAPYLKPAALTYGEYVYADSEAAERITYNNDGHTYEKGSNFRAGFSTYAEFGRISLDINPEIRFSEGDTDMTVRRAYGVFSFAGLDLELGKDSQWWGPGHHGSLLLSDNAEPLTILKLSNPEPVVLPSVFRYLGLFKFTFFATRLEDDRAVPHPLLWGLRVNIKPNPYLDVGLQRTALFGGEGRPENLKTFLRSFTGKGESEADVEAGDQRAGIDITLTFPFARQPFQVYAEAAGEDEAGALPQKWAYLAGIYLPQIGRLECLELRMEYAGNHVKNHPDVWYNHHIYLSGYTYKGRVIGHHMGTDSKDIFTEMRYRFPGSRNGFASVAYDREEHNLSGDVHETEDETIIKIHVPLNRSTVLKAEYRFGKLNNFSSIRRADRKINIATTAITYEF